MSSTPCRFSLSQSIFILNKLGLLLSHRQMKDITFPISTVNTWFLASYGFSFLFFFFDLKICFSLWPLNRLKNCSKVSLFLSYGLMIPIGIVQDMFATFPDLSQILYGVSVVFRHVKALNKPYSCHVILLYGWYSAMLCIAVYHILTFNDSFRSLILIAFQTLFIKLTILSSMQIINSLVA